VVPTLIALVLLASSALTSTATGQEDAPEAHHTAAVQLDGVDLFRVRGVSAIPADERARLISERIEEVAGDPSIVPDAVQSVARGAAMEIKAGERLLLTMFEADARREDVNLPTLADVTANRIRVAIVTYRHDRSVDELRRNAGYGAVVTLILAIAIVLVILAWRRLVAILEERYRHRIEALSQQTFRLVEAERVFAALSGLVRGARSVVILALVLVWVSVVLDLFPWTRPFERRVVGYVLTPLAILARGLVALVPNLVFLAIVAALTRWVLGLLFLFFSALDQGTIRLAGFEREWAWATHRIARVVAIVFALVVAFPYIPGSDSEAFRGVTIFLGIMFSLGSSSIIANALAGYSLIYRRAFKIGDRVKIGEVVGDVTEMRLQVTHVRTPKREEVVVPNSSILASEVVNYSSYARAGGVILHTTVGIGYEVPWRQVEAMLLLAAERTPGLRHDPPPFVLVRALGDFAVTYEINALCDDAQAMFLLYSVLHREILDVFNEHGVQIMTPAYEGDPEQPKTVAKERWFEPPAKRE